MNRWNIPDWLEREVIERDRRCIYCGVDFAAEITSRRGRPSWEHGTKSLGAWLESEYCKTRGITRDSVASVARSFLASRTVPVALA